MPAFGRLLEQHLERKELVQASCTTQKANSDERVLSEQLLKSAWEEHRPMEPLEQVSNTWFDTLHPAFIELRTSGTRDYACESMQMIRKQLRSCAEFLLVNGEVSL